MSLFVISDLHLSLGENINKPMEVFGTRWQNYISKLERNWKCVVSDSDNVVISGDISWAVKLEEAVPDIKFIDSLPGTKYILKGNHDFWWQTNAKMNRMFEKNDIKTVKILYNNAYKLDNLIICGSRGWFTDKQQQNTVGNVEYEKIINREVIRLRLSLNEATRLKEKNDCEIIVFLHFPPVYHDFVSREILDVLHEFKITRCYFGHIHGVYNIPKSYEYEGVKFSLTSADFLDFAALPIFT